MMGPGPLWNGMGWPLSPGHALGFLLLEIELYIKAKLGDGSRSPLEWHGLPPPSGHAQGLMLLEIKA